MLFKFFSKSVHSTPHSAVGALWRGVAGRGGRSSGVSVAALKYAQRSTCWYATQDSSCSSSSSSSCTALNTDRRTACPARPGQAGPGQHRARYRTRTTSRTRTKPSSSFFHPRTCRQICRFCFGILLPMPYSVLVTKSTPAIEKCFAWDCLASENPSFCRVHVRTLEETDNGVQ